MPNLEPQEPTIVDGFVAPPCDEAVVILYQDSDILLIGKPSGLLSLSGKNPLNWDSVHHRLIHGQEGISPPFQEAKLPHRLDFGTSGIMLVSLSGDAAKNLNKQFQSGSIKKRYVAMLEGSVANESGEISAAIAKDKTIFPRVKISHAGGKAAVTKYKVLKRLEQPQRTLVEFTPDTGRTHQLRIHSLEMGHPILGCDLYSSPSSPQLADRLMLHASDCWFAHPTTGEPIHAHCPSPFVD